MDCPVGDPEHTSCPCYKKGIQKQDASCQVAAAKKTHWTLIEHYYPFTKGCSVTLGWEEIEGAEASADVCFLQDRSRRCTRHLLGVDRKKVTVLDRHSLLLGFSLLRNHKKA